MAQGVQKYAGCSLEIFEDVDIDELMLGTIPGRIQAHGLQPGDYFIRHAIFDLPPTVSKPFDTIDSTIESVDRHFTFLANAIGATVIEHDWGLMRRSSERRGYYPELERFGIEEYLLAARVPVLAGRPVLFSVDPYSYPLQKNLTQASETYVQNEGWTTDADWLNQFTVHTQNGTSKLVLHDIEPRIKTKSSRPFIIC